MCRRLVFDVSFAIKVTKQHQKYRHIADEEEAQRARDRALEADDQQQIHEHDAKLGQLERRQVPLPPEEPLVAGAEGRDQVVAVHHHVNVRVQDAEEGTLDSWGKEEIVFFFYWVEVSVRSVYFFLAVFIKFY